MPPLYYFSLALFMAVIANDWLLARKIRKAVESQRLRSNDFDSFHFGGSPLGIVLNLFRLRKIPEPNDLSDPDHIAIQRHYRAHQVLVALLASCIAVLFLRRFAT